MQKYEEALKRALTAPVTSTLSTGTAASLEATTGMLTESTTAVPTMTGWSLSSTTAVSTTAGYSTTAVSTMQMSSTAVSTTQMTVVETEVTSVVPMSEGSVGSSLEDWLPEFGLEEIFFPVSEMEQCRRDRFLFACALLLVAVTVLLYIVYR